MSARRQAGGDGGERGGDRHAGVRGRRDRFPRWTRDCRSSSPGFPIRRSRWRRWGTRRPRWATPSTGSASSSRAGRSGRSSGRCGTRASSRTGRPEGKALLRVMVGGVRAPALAVLPEPELLALVREELGSILGISAEPVLAKAFLHDRGIPQISRRPREAAGADRRAAGGASRIHLNSNAYRGIALNDCVRESRATPSGSPGPCSPPCPGITSRCTIWRR